MKNPKWIRALAIAGLACALISGCTKKKDRDVSQELVRPLSDDEVILEYNGGKITAADVREKMVPHFEQARESLLNDYVRTAKAALAERNQPKTQAAPELSNFELESYMKANHIPESEKEKIRVFLTAEKQRLANQEAQQSLFDSLNVRNKLGAARFDVEATSKMPQLGPANAKVTIQLFCDFANPMCNRARLLIAQTRTEFGDKIRWVYRFFPVASNPGGTEAAMVALCAQDQGQFWPVHDRLLDLGPTLAKANLTEVAAKVPGINEKTLTDCLRSENTKRRLDAELASANSLAITATPVYLVNGSKVENSEDLTATLHKLAP